MAGKYTAQHEIRQNLGCLLWITAFGGLGTAINGLRDLPEMHGWVQLVVGLDLIAVAVGMWYAKEWARWAGGIVASLYGSLLLVKVIRKAAIGGEPAALLGLVGVALMGLLAWYSFRPATRKSFADAREAIARSRAQAR